MKVWMKLAKKIRKLQLFEIWQYQRAILVKIVTSCGQLSVCFVQEISCFSTFRMTCDWDNFLLWNHNVASKNVFYVRYMHRHCLTLWRLHLKKMVELWCLYCMMMVKWTNKQPGTQKFGNSCSHYQDIYDWISPLNKRSGRPKIRLYLHMWWVMTDTILWHFKGIV